MHVLVPWPEPDASAADAVPARGGFRRVAGSREPNGVMEEHAMFAARKEFELLKLLSADKKAL